MVPDDKWYADDVDEDIGAVRMVCAVKGELE